MLQPERKRILLVDDSATSLLMVRMILEELPFELATAGDGEEALAKAQSFRPDLIVMDVMMPRLNGFEACQRLRQTEAGKDVPIILLTTRGEMNNIEAGYASGCTDYLTKPVDALELLLKVQGHLV